MLIQIWTSICCFPPIPTHLLKGTPPYDVLTKPLPGYISLCGKLKSMSIHSNLPHVCLPTVWHQKKRAALEFRCRSAHVQLNISRLWTHTSGRAFAPSELLVKETKPRSQLSCFLSFQPSLFHQLSTSSREGYALCCCQGSSWLMVDQRESLTQAWILPSVFAADETSTLTTSATPSLHFGSVMTRAPEHGGAFLTPLRPYSTSIWLCVAVTANHRCLKPKYANTTAAAQTNVTASVADARKDSVHGAFSLQGNQVITGKSEDSL